MIYNSLKILLRQLLVKKSAAISRKEICKNYNLKSTNLVQITWRIATSFSKRKKQPKNSSSSK